MGKGKSHLKLIGRELMLQGCCCLLLLSLQSCNLLPQLLCKLVSSNSVCYFPFDIRAQPGNSTPLELADASETGKCMCMQASRCVCVNTIIVAGS